MNVDACHSIGEMKEVGSTPTNGGHITRSTRQYKERQNYEENPAQSFRGPVVENGGSGTGSKL